MANPAAAATATSAATIRATDTVSTMGAWYGPPGLDRGGPPYRRAMARSLVVKLTAGTDAPERCSQGFTVAATALAAGADVSLWLTGESAWFALPGRAEQFALPEAPPLADLLASLLAGGRVTLCTQCAARRGITPNDVLAGVRIAGAASFVAEILEDGAQALVY